MGEERGEEGVGRGEGGLKVSQFSDWRANVPQPSIKIVNRNLLWEESLLKRSLLSLLQDSVLLTDSYYM